jgi:iron complex transport system substrate-binding protein
VVETMTGLFASCCLLLSLGNAATAPSASTASNTAAASASSMENLGPVPKAPIGRIASIAPSLTQAVVFLGAENKLVAISRFDEQPSLQHLPKAGGFSDVAVETLLKLRPDVVLVQKAPGNEAPIRRLAAQGIPVLAFALTTIKDVCQTMALLGELLEAQEKAQAWLSSFEALRQQLRASAPPKRPRVLLLVGLSPLIAAGPGSFADELIGEAGGQNVVARSSTPFPVVSLESIFHQKPELIINLAEFHEGQSHLRSLPGLRDARWISAPDKGLLQPGPALLPVLRQMAAWFGNPHAALPSPSVNSKQLHCDKREF